MAAAALRPSHFNPISKIKTSSSRAYSIRHPRRTPESISPDLKRLIDLYSQQSPRPLSLSTLLSFSQPLTPESLLQSASYVLEDIPRRLVRRVRALEKLPFIVGTNPFVAKTLDVHRKSFEWLVTHPDINTLEENARFAKELETLVQNHTNDIPTMAKGYVSSTNFSPSLLVLTCSLNP